jgi:general secretion pathway protein G
MYLEGQGDRPNGYAMAALLVSLAVMAVLMTAALPVWRHQAQREKEAELVWRIDQYARAIYLYQRRNGPANYPPNLDVLVQGKFLRKKYKDPMTKDGEWELLRLAAQPGKPGGQTQFQATGGITGVVSKSKETSIRVDRGSTYNTYRANVPRPQPGVDPNNPQGRPGMPTGPGRGGRGTGPGQRGGSPFGPGVGPGIGPGRGREGRIGFPPPGRGAGGRGPG